MTGPQDLPGAGAPWQQPTQPQPPQPNGPVQGGQQWSPPAEPAYQLSGEPVLVAIGDISVTQTRVFTPSGVRPLSEVSWTVTDGSVTTTAIPTWAIVCAIIGFFFFLLGLLFLLVRETRTTGAMQVTVYAPGFVHTTQIPVISPAQVVDINARVNHARMIAGAFGAQAGLAAPQQPGVQTPPSGLATPQQPGFAPQAGFAPQPGFAQQQGFAPPPGSTPQPGFAAPQAPQPQRGVAGQPGDAAGQEPTRGW
jgi:hypothetical protein